MRTITPGDRKFRRSRVEDMVAKEASRATVTLASAIREGVKGFAVTETSPILYKSCVKREGVCAMRYGIDAER